MSANLLHAQPRLLAQDYGLHSHGPEKEVNNPVDTSISHDRPVVSNTERFYLDGKWVGPSGRNVAQVLDSATETMMGSVLLGQPEDVANAVAAARSAHEEWSSLDVGDRQSFLRSIAAGLRSREETLARMISCEVGTPLSVARSLQAAIGPADFESTADAMDGFEWQQRIGHTMVTRDAIGVVAAITPWNYPLHQASVKVAPALAVGCTVVLKPSEIAPFSAFVLAEVCDEVGLPPGVFNLLTGTGSVVGEALASHPAVDMVSFTGSARAGRRVSELSATTIKRVVLELGGKSANIILGDADLEMAVRSGIANCFTNSGQTCTALTRMLVPKGKLSEVEEIAHAAATEFVVGDPLDPRTTLGPLVSGTQRDKVLQYIDAGIAEGAKPIVDGSALKFRDTPGYYVGPTVLSEVGNDMTIAREEIFGPVLSIISYDSEAQAITMANDSPYGLAGAVWSQDVDHAVAVARRVRTGVIDVNGADFNLEAPFGGYRQSGNGRELGRWGIDEFLETKSINCPQPTSAT